MPLTDSIGGHVEEVPLISAKGTHRDLSRTTAETHLQSSYKFRGSDDLLTTARGGNIGLNFS